MRAWMIHDALWYGEVAARFGMAEVSPMNLRYIRTPDVSRSLKPGGQKRRVTVRLDFSQVPGSAP
jgi:hypothetical protein